MDKTYSVIEALSLVGRSAAWTVSTRTVIQSGSTYVQSSMDSKSITIACLKFQPTATSDNIHVSFDFAFQNMQTASRKAWFVGISESEPTNVRPSADSLIGYQTFAADSSYAVTKRMDFTMNGNFRSGRTYYFIVGMTETAYNRGSILNVNSIVFHALNVSGATAYIWTSQEAGAETFSQTVNAGNTFRSLEGYQSSAFVKSSTTGIGGQNIIGIGRNENTGSRLYFNAGCIPVSGVSRPLRSVKISFPVLYNGTGTHNYRWAISTTPPGASSPYINTLSEVTEPGQIASGTFHDYSSSRNEYTFFADIPANADFYVYLWSHGTEDGVKRYGNFHIQGDISITLTAEAQSGMGWVAFNPYIWQNGAWQEMTCNIYKDGSWES